MATDAGTGETWRARRGHDDLVIAVSMGGWYLENQGPNFASWEYFRRQAGVPLQSYCVAVDFGQSVDNCAICVMSRTSAPVLETGVELVKPPTGGAIVDLPTPIQQPESTASPPDLASPEWQHEVAEGQKALLRGQGFSSSGPLKAIATFPRVLPRRMAVRGRSNRSQGSGPQTARLGQMFRCAVEWSRERRPSRHQDHFACCGNVSFDVPIASPSLAREETRGA